MAGGVSGVGQSRRSLHCWCPSNPKASVHRAPGIGHRALRAAARSGGAAAGRSAARRRRRRGGGGGPTSGEPRAAAAPETYRLPSPLPPGMRLGVPGTAGGAGGSQGCLGGEGAPPSGCCQPWSQVWWDLHGSPSRAKHSERGECGRLSSRGSLRWVVPANIAAPSFLPTRLPLLSLCWIRPWSTSCHSQVTSRRVVGEGMRPDGAPEGHPPTADASTAASTAADAAATSRQAEAAVPSCALQSTATGSLNLQGPMLAQPPSALSKHSNGSREGRPGHNGRRHGLGHRQGRGPAPCSVQPMQVVFAPICSNQGAAVSR